MPLGAKTKSILNFIARIVFSVALLVFLFYKIDMTKTREVLKAADISYLMTAWGVFLFVHSVLLYRWWGLIKALDLEISFLNVTRYFFIGLFGNLFLPSAIGGDLIKVLGLCKKSSQKPRVVASVLLDRLSGFVAVVLVAVCAFVIGYKLINDITLLFPIAAVATFFICFIVLLFHEKAYAFGCRLFNKFPNVKKNLMDMHYDVALLKRKHKQRAGINAILLSCVSQTCFSVTFFLTAKALHQDVQLVCFLVFVPLICIAATFPSIGGLGVREAGAAYLFSRVGIDSGIAVSISLINFLFMVVIGLIGGIIYVATVPSGRIQHH